MSCGQIGETLYMMKCNHWNGTATRAGHWYRSIRINACDPKHCRDRVPLRRLEWSKSRSFVQGFNRPKRLPVLGFNTSEIMEKGGSPTYIVFLGSSQFPVQRAPIAFRVSRNMYELVMIMFPCYRCNTSNVV